MSDAPDLDALERAPELPDWISDAFLAEWNDLLRQKFTAREGSPEMAEAYRRQSETMAVQVVSWWEARGRKRWLTESPNADAALRGAVEERDRQLWECEKCGFRFSREHENADGSGYSCPVCELAAGATREARLREALDEGIAVVTTLEARQANRAGAPLRCLECDLKNGKHATTCRLGRWYPMVRAALAGAATP